MKNTEKNFQFNNEESLNIRAELEKYIVHWKWFLLSVLICTSIAIFYAKTKVNIFQSKASMLIKEEDGASSELMAFQDLSSLGFGGSKNVYNEIEVLKSRTLIGKCVKKLKLNVTVTQQKGLKEVELYGEQTPFKYQIISDVNAFYKLDTFFTLEAKNEEKFHITFGDDKIDKEFSFGEKVKIKDHTLIFTPVQNNDLKKDIVYNYEVKSLNNTVEDLTEDLNIVSPDDTNIVSLSLKHSLKYKAEHILNTLIDIYNEMSIEDKNLVGEKTDNFISDRLKEIKIELDEIDRIEEAYKSDKQITDIALQSQVFVGAKSDNELKKFKTETDLRMVQFMIEDINKQQEDFELLPANIGSSESNTSFSSAIAKYNDLLFERNRLLRNSTNTNPIVLNLNSELLYARNNIKETLYNIKKQLNISLKSLNSVEQEFKSRISSLPKQSREYRSILRRQTIIAELYSYLLQKKEENEISLAITVSDAKIIDRAYSLKAAVAPKKPIIALVGLILGLVIPFSVIYIRDLLDNKFHNKDDVSSLVSLPLLGDIPFDKTEEKVVVKKGSRTSTAEAFRLLRTNLDFMLTSVNDKCKTLFVTSTVSGEGKTFVSVNTAASIALTGKKVLLVGLDLRAPKITQYLGLPNQSGVTNYILDSELNIEDLIVPLGQFENLDLLSSGVVPPNPAELLLSPRINELLDGLKDMYDFIIVDTAPVNLVTDTLMLSKYADMFIYVSRVNYLDKKFLEVPERLYQEKRLPNVALLLNGIDYSRSYGYGSYGYGYGNYGGYVTDNDKVGFFKRLFNKS